MTSSGSDADSHTVFKIEIRNKLDIIALENKIRQLLHCESVGCCNVLQTATYKQMITALLLRLNNVISFEEKITIFFGCNAMSIVMLNDAQTVEIRSHTTMLGIDDSATMMVPNRKTDRRRRKYARQKQEDSFVSKYLSSKSPQ
jgi:hypothetical protein